MKPPICYICRRKFRPGTYADGTIGGKTVKFANYQPLPKHTVGHPKGLVWVCETHLDAARALTELTSGEARSQILQNSAPTEEHA